MIRATNAAPSGRVCLRQNANALENEPNIREVIASEISGRRNDGRPELWKKTT